MSHEDDYLWDRGGPVDAEVAALERLLSPHAWRPRERTSATSMRRVSASVPAVAPPPSSRTRARRRRWPLAWAAVATLAVCGFGLQAWYAHRLQWPQAQPWRIAGVEGSVRIDGEALAGDGTLAPGSELETGADGSARLRVARIGEMVLGPGSRFAVIETGDGRHRTALRSGRLWARIWAPPGSFGVATPAGDVFDLGCEFVLVAGEDGSGSLTVRSGWVQIDNHWREVLVPEGARVDFSERGEPGIPYDLGASDGFRSALRELQRHGDTVSSEGPEVRALVAASRPQDAISLLALMQAHPRLAEGPLFDRMVQVMPADARVTRAAVRAEGGRAMHAWWNALPYPRMKRWWLQWPDAFRAGGDRAELLDERTK